MIKQKRDDKLVIGVVGLKAAGKDAFCDYLRKKRNFDVRRLSDPIREECRRRGITVPTVADLQDVSDEMKRQTGDFGYWAGQAIRMAWNEGSRLVVINGIRNPGEIDALAAVAGDQLVLVGVVAPINIRIERFLRRGRAGDPVTMEDFLLMDDRDRGINQPPEGQQVDRCLARVPHENIYSNEGEIEEFYIWIDDLLNRSFNRS